jgi:hypothetical protein
MGGGKEIRKQDIPQLKSGPMLTVINAEILKFKADTTIGDESGKFIPLERDIFQNELCIDFDFLNKGDAFFGEVYLTNENEHPPITRFSGSFKGCPKILEGDCHNITKFESGFFIVTFLILVMTFVMSGLSSYAKFTSGNYDFVYMLIACIFSLFLTVIMYKYNIASIQNKIPEKHLKFLETGDM